MKKSDLKNMTEEQLKEVAKKRTRNGKGSFLKIAIEAQEELWERDEGLRYPNIYCEDPEVLYNGRDDPYDD